MRKEHLLGGDAESTVYECTKCGYRIEYRVFHGAKK
jgi:DNA-directed RNA polymerase subunit RPC12/RpoP